MADGQPANETLCTEMEQACQVSTAYRWTVAEVEAEEVTKKVLGDLILKIYLLYGFLQL